MVELLEHLSADGVDCQNGVYLVAEILYANQIIRVREGNVDGIALDAEASTSQLDVVAQVLCRNELLKQIVHWQFVAYADTDGAGCEVLRATEAVDAADRTDDDDVLAPAQQSC